MPFKILCSCGVALLAGDDLESYKVACPECGNYTLLPAVPNLARLPANAQKIFIEAVKEKPRKQEKPGTIRKRGGVSRSNMGGRGDNNGDMSTANMVLIIVLVVVVIVILIVGLLYASKSG